MIVLSDLNWTIVIPFFLVVLVGLWAATSRQHQSNLDSRKVYERGRSKGRAEGFALGRMIAIHEMYKTIRQELVEKFKRDMRLLHDLYKEEENSSNLN